MSILPALVIALALLGSAQRSGSAAGQSVALEHREPAQALPFDVAEGPLPEFDEEVDVVIHQEDLEDFIAEVDRNSEPYEGWVVGVIPPEEVSAERQAVIDGGEAAAAIDQGRQTAAASRMEQVEGPPPCPEDDPGHGAGIYLACRGHEPASVFRARPALNSLMPADAMKAAIQELASEVADSESHGGLYSILATIDGGVTGVRTEGSTVVVDFSGSIKSDQLESTFVSSVLIDQVVATAVQFEGIEAVQFQIEGSCESFSDALGAAPCHEYKPEPTETLG